VYVLRCSREEDPIREDLVDAGIRAIKDLGVAIRTDLAARPVAEFGEIIVE
jgi:hypothetical protein